MSMDLFVFPILTLLSFNFSQGLPLGRTFGQSHHLVVVDPTLLVGLSLVGQGQVGWVQALALQDHRSTSQDLLGLAP